MKKIILLFIVIIFSVSGFAQPTIQWQKSLGGGLYDYASSIIQTSDGGYVAAGSSQSNDGDVTGNHGEVDYWIVKLDGSGNIQWQKCLGGTASEGANSIQQTIDGGYVVAGYSGSNDGDVSGHHGNANIADYWIVKLDVSGNIQWQKCLGGTAHDIANSIIETGDGGYMVGGSGGSTNGDITGNHGGYDYWIVKLDSSGNIQWQKCLGGTADDIANSIIETSDGGYVAAGYSASNDGDVTGNHGFTDYWIVELDASGNIQWQKCLGGTVNDIAYSIIETSDGGYTVTGSGGSTNGDVTGNHGWYDYWIVKLDGSGNIQWQKCRGGTVNDIPSSIMETNDGGYIIGGDSYSNDGNVTGHHGNVGIADYWIVKLNASGNIQWQKSLGGDTTDNASSNIQTSDGGYIVAGHSWSNDGDVTGNHGAADYWIVKLAPYVGIEEENIFSSINIAPNPATNELRIENAGLRIREIEIYNIVGEKCLTPTLSKGEGVRVDVSSLPAGVYFVAVTDDKGNKITRKFIKM